MLEKKTYKILKRFYRKKKISYEELEKMTGINEKTCQSQYVSCLFVHHFVSNWGSDETHIVGGLKQREALGLKITLEGSAYVEKKRKDAFMFWVPYTITTLVAIAGLLVAIAGLLRTVPTSENQGNDDPSRSQAQMCILDASEKECVRS